jgi:hypothetical protein
LEHAASAATKKECSFTNIVGPKPICEDVPIPKVIDNSNPLPGLTLFRLRSSYRPKRL